MGYDVNFNMLFFLSPPLTITECHRNCGIVALMVLGWSANIRKLAKNHKGYGSAAQELIACLKTVSIFPH
jgi:hypothetical protein